MRRSAISVLAALVLLGLIAAPAGAADPYPFDRMDRGYFLHTQRTFVHLCSPFCPVAVKELPTGEWADIGQGWATITDAQRDEFLEAVVVEIEGDGVVYRDLTPHLFVYGGLYGATYAVLRPPQAAGEVQEWTIRYIFIADHFDGWNFFPAGTVLEVTRTIVWTPRGRFPSGDYPPSDY